MTEGPSRGSEPWRLRGLPRHVAEIVTAALIGVTVVVAVVNHATRNAWDWTLLQNWSLVPHLWAVGGLLFIGWIRRRVAFLSLGFLVSLIFVEEAFHVLNSVARMLDRLAQGVEHWTEVESGGIGAVVFYSLVAVVGLSILTFSYRRASTGERRVVRTLAILLVVGGLFGGPVSTLAMRERPILWLFVEELGEALVYAIIGGYVAGLAYLSAQARSRGRSRVRRSLPSRRQRAPERTGASE